MKNVLKKSALVKKFPKNNEFFKIFFDIGIDSLFRNHFDA